MLRVVLWLALVSSWALASGARAQPKVLFVGDSITRGTGATTPAEDGFVARLEERFPELLVANAGCGGSTTRDWTFDTGGIYCALGSAWRLAAEPELPAQITHVMLGTNGALGFFEHFGPVSPDEYEWRLRLLVEKAPGLVLVSSPPRNPPRPTGAVDDRLRGYRDAIDRVVDAYPYAEHGVDGYALLDPALDFLPGNIHPNDRGHARLADALERRILELLPPGALSPCANARACERFRFLPQYQHPHGREAR